MSRTIALLATLALTQACTTDDDNECSRHASRSCPCLGDAAGTQSCLSDGSGYAACMCPLATAQNVQASTGCVAGQAVNCPCMDGAMGTQVCSADGTAYDTCACPMPDGPGVGEQTDGTAGMAAPDIDYPPCPDGLSCDTLPANPEQPVCLDPMSPEGFPLPPPCDVVEDCAQYGLDLTYTQCLETATGDYDFGSLCFTGCPQ